MSPDKEWGNRWPFFFLAFTFTKEAWDNLSHKGTVTLGVAILASLLYWGFSRTFAQIDKIESRQIEVIKNQGDFIKNQADAKTELIKYQGELKADFISAMSDIKCELSKVEQKVEDHILQTEKYHGNGSKK